MKLRGVRLVTNGCLLGALCSMGVEAQQPTVKYFWSNGRQVPVAAIPNLVAIESSPGASGALDAQVIQEMASEGPSELARAVNLTASGVRFVKARAGRAPQLRAALRTGRARELGVPVDVGSPTKTTRPYAVLTPEFIVRFKRDVTRQTIDDLNKKLGAEIVREDTFVPNQFLLRVADGSAARTLELSDTYFKQKDVVDGLAQPNFIYPRETRSAIHSENRSEHRSEHRSGIPSGSNDPLRLQQWHLDTIDVATAWRVSQGEDVIVAVIDPEGVEIKHEDLFPNRFINTHEIPDNNTDDDNNLLVDDVTGWNFRERNHDPMMLLPHGTAAAAVALATCDNSLGGCGVAPKARLLPIAQGRTNQEDADAIRYAMQMGAGVISASWGYPIGLPTTQVVEEAIAEVMAKGRSGLGTAVVFAMTNQERDNFGGGADGYRDIASVPGVLAIGRSTDEDKWGHSGFGDGMWLLAPTSAARGNANRGCLPEDLLGKREIVTADLMGEPGYNAGTPKPCFCNASAAEIGNLNYTGCFQGTSSSTPLVAGVVALMIGAKPAITVDAIRDILAETAERIEPTVAAYKPDARLRLRSVTHGYGRVHAGRAVAAAAAWIPPAAPPPTPQAAPLPTTQAGRASSAPKESSPSPGANQPAQPSQAASQPATQPAAGQAGDTKVAGKASVEVRVPNGARNDAAYVWENATALILAKGASTSTVMNELAGTAKLVSGYSWTLGLWEGRNVIVIEPTNGGSAERIADLHERGLVQGTGRVAFFDKAGRNVSVIPNRFLIDPSESAREPELAAEAARHGFKLEARFGGVYELTPLDGTQDALEVARRAEQFAKSPLVRPSSLRPDWMSPVEVRQPRQ